MKTYTEGDLRVWHVPQIPGSPFYYDAPDVKTALLLCEVLGDYDAFLLEGGHRCDYFNVNGVERYETDGEGGFDWYSVEEDELGAQ